MHVLIEQIYGSKQLICHMAL